MSENVYVYASIHLIISYEEPIPVDTEHEAGYTLDRAPVHGDKEHYTLTFTTMSNLESSVRLTWTSLNRGRTYRERNLNSWGSNTGSSCCEILWWSLYNMYIIQQLSNKCCDFKSFFPMEMYCSTMKWYYSGLRTYLTIRLCYASPTFSQFVFQWIQLLSFR